MQLLGRIMDFDGTESAWPDFKFQFRGMVRKLSPEVLDILDIAETSSAVLNQELLTADSKEASRRVFFWFSMVTRGTALGIARDVEDGSGLEVWRLLCKKNEARSARQRLGMLHSLTTFDFNSMRDFEQRCQTFERLCRQYEGQAGETISESNRMAALLATAPIAVRKHVQLNAAAYLTSADMRDAILDFARNADEWRTQETPPSNSTPAPMDVNAVCWIGKGKGKCKGKEKGKGKGTEKGRTAAGIPPWQRNEQPWHQNEQHVDLPGRWDLQCWLCGGWGHEQKHCGNHFYGPDWDRMQVDAIAPAGTDSLEVSAVLGSELEGNSGMNRVPITSTQQGESTGPSRPTSKNKHKKKPEEADDFDFLEVVDRQSSFNNPWIF